MRDILFRAKRIDNDEWIYGYFSRHTTGKTFIRPIGKNCQYSAEVIPKSVSEFTGLTDKNDTKIFEGDIVTIVLPHFPTTSGVIVYDKDFFGVDIKGVSPIQHCVAYAIKEGSVEVIGNIHDNPELLND